MKKSKHPHRQDDTEPKGGPLARWSERKSRSRIGANVIADDDQPENAVSNDPLQKRDEDMPPVGSLDENSDVSEFFSSGVSEELRRAALRKFFHSPAFNIVDGLDDYDDDFTKFAALGDIITADMRHRMELEEQANREAKADDDTLAEGGEAAAGDLEQAADPEEQGQSRPDDEARSPGSGEEEHLEDTDGTVEGPQRTGGDDVV